MTESQVLRRLDYPAYCIKLLDNGLVALAGGGGTAKTGVGNSIELGFVSYANNLAQFKEIHRFQSEDAIMKFVSFTLERTHSKKQSKINDLFLAAALNQTVEIYKIQPCLTKTDAKTQIEPSASIKQVSKITLSDTDDSITTLQVYKNTKKVLLIFATRKGLIHIYNLVIERNNNITDNKLNFEKIHEFNQSHEIDELQVNSDGILLSIGKDSCYVWSVESLKKLTEFKYLNFVNDSNLRIKHARFSKDSKIMYLSFIPRIRGGKMPTNSYIQRWSKIKDGDKEGGMNYRLERTVRIRGTIVTCLQSSKDGYFVSAGDCDGKIYLYDHELNKLQDFKKQHSSVITDLCFYYDEEFDLRKCSQKFDLNKFILTISIDRTVQLYKFLNTGLTRRFLDAINRELSTGVFSLCLFSMSLFKFFLILILLFVSFCYFFVNFET